MARAEDWLNWIKANHDQRLEYLRSKHMNVSKGQASLTLTQDELESLMRDHATATQWLMLEGKKRGLSDSIDWFVRTKEDIDEALADKKLI